MATLKIPGYTAQLKQGNMSVPTAQPVDSSGARAVGQGLLSVHDQLQDAYDTEQFTGAQVEFVRGANEIESRLAESGDYINAPKQYREEMAALRDGLSKGLNQRVAAKAQPWMDLKMEGSAVQFDKANNSRLNESKRAEFIPEIDGLLNGIVEAGDDAAREEAANLADMRFEAMRPFYKPEQFAKLYEGFQENAIYYTNKRKIDESGGRWFEAHPDLSQANNDNLKAHAERLRKEAEREAKEAAMSRAKIVSAQLDDQLTYAARNGGEFGNAGAVNAMIAELDRLGFGEAAQEAREQVADIGVIGDAVSLVGPNGEDRTLPDLVANLQSLIPTSAADAERNFKVYDAASKQLVDMVKEYEKDPAGFAIQQVAPALVAAGVDVSSTEGQAMLLREALEWQERFVPGGSGTVLPADVRDSLKAQLATGDTEAMRGVFSQVDQLGDMKFKAMSEIDADPAGQLGLIIPDPLMSSKWMSVYGKSSEDLTTQPGFSRTDAQAEIYESDVFQALTGAADVTGSALAGKQRDAMMDHLLKLAQENGTDFAVNVLEESVDYLNTDKVRVALPKGLVLDVDALETALEGASSEAVLTRAYPKPENMPQGEYEDEIANLAETSTWVNHPDGGGRMVLIDGVTGKPVMRGDGYYVFDVANVDAALRDLGEFSTGLLGGGQ